MKSQCDKHGCQELLCGCSLSEVEASAIKTMSEIILEQAVQIAELKGEINEARLLVKEVRKTWEDLWGKDL